jgi:hypothetical protein
MMKWLIYLALVAIVESGLSDTRIRQEWTGSSGDDWRYQTDMRTSFSRVGLGGSYWRKDGELLRRPHVAAWLRLPLSRGWRLGLGDWRPPSDGILFGQLRSSAPPGSSALVFRPKEGRVGRVNPEYRGLLLWRETGDLRGGLWWARTQRDQRVDGTSFLLDLRHGDSAESRVKAWRDHLRLLWLELGPVYGFDVLGLYGRRESSAKTTTLASLRLRRRSPHYNGQIEFSRADSRAIRFRFVLRPERGFKMLLFADYARGSKTAFAGFGRSLEEDRWNHRFGMSLTGRNKKQEWELGWFSIPVYEERARVEQRLRFRRVLMQNGWLGVLYSSKGESMSPVEQTRRSLFFDLALRDGKELRLSWTTRDDQGVNGRTGRVRSKFPFDLGGEWRGDWRIDLSWHEGMARDWQVNSWWPGGLRFQQLAGESYHGGISTYIYNKRDIQFGMRIDAGFRLNSEVDVRMGVMCSWRQKNRHLP